MSWGSLVAKEPFVMKTNWAKLAMWLLIAVLVWVWWVGLFNILGWAK
jgi:hypothetical protein